ncbi:MAG TPA: TonB-dependent receptor [bacterium]|nr:TonB-dependent receptor [bacterium]
MTKTPALTALIASIASAPLLLAQSPQNPSPTRESATGERGATKQKPANQQPGESDRARVVVTASGFAEEALRTPYTFQQVSSEQLVERGSRTLPEALRYTPGVMVQKTAQGHGSPYIRGFTGRQNLILVDGIRINNSTFRGGPIQYWNTIDSFSMDRMEVIKSQGSVLFGSDAIGGTVNVFTRSADFRSEADGSFFQHGRTFYRFDSNGLSQTGRVEAQVGEGGVWGLHIGATYRNFGDIRDRSLGEMPQTGYDEFDYDLRFDAAYGDSGTLTLAHQRVEQNDIWRTHRTVFFEPWEGTSLSNPDLARIYDQERSLSYLRLADDDVGSGVSKYSLTFSFQQQNEFFFRQRTAGANVRNQNDYTDVDTYGVALQLESQVGDGTLVYGADYYVDTVSSTRREVRVDPMGAVVSDTFAVQGPVGDGARYDLFGAFAQYRMPVTDDLEVTIGGRYTYAAANIDRLDDGNGNAVSANRNFDQATFNLRANQRVGDDSTVYGGIAQAFRAPNLDDLSSLKSSRTDLISTGSIDVEPEKYLTYELGYRLLTADSAFNASVYYTDIEDLIVSRPVGTVPGTGEVITASTNGSNGYAYGFELEGEHRLCDAWTASGFLAWVDGESDRYPSNSTTPVREKLSRLMPLTGSLAVRWQEPENPLWVGARVLVAGRADRMNSGDRSDTSRFPPKGTPSYIVLALNSGYRVNEHFELFFTLDNATDTAYRVHGSGVNEPGINAILGGRLTW